MGQHSNVFLSFLLLGSQSFSSEGVHSISFPTARKIGTNHAVIRGSWIAHQNLSTVVKLEGTASRKEQSHRHFPFVKIFIQLRVNAAHIMVVRKNHNVVNIAVHVVISQTLINLRHAASPAGFTIQSFNQSRL